MTERAPHPATEQTAPLTRRDLRHAAETASSDAGRPPADTADAVPRTTAPLEVIVTADTDAPTPAADDAERRPGGVLRAITTGLLVGLLLAVLSVAAVAIVVPAATGSSALTVLTSSMEPRLPPGTLIVVRPTDPSEIRAGDIITYQLESGKPALVTHRVVQALLLVDGTPVFATQGDANPTQDPELVQPVQVRGVLWYAIPYLGWVSSFVTGDARPLVLPVIVGALFAYAAWMFISSARDRARRRRATD